MAVPRRSTSIGDLSVMRCTETSRPVVVRGGKSIRDDTEGGDPMLNRNALLLVAGVAIFALDASAASAQAKKPTSTKRIPLTKESPGEVAPPRVDTVTVYRTDTLRVMGRTDTIRATGATVTVHDTVVQSVPMVARHIGG